MKENGRFPSAEQSLPPEADGLNSRFERLVKTKGQRRSKWIGFALRGEIPANIFDLQLLEQFGLVLPPDPISNHVFGGKKIQYLAVWNPKRVKPYTLAVNGLCFQWGKSGHSTVSCLPTENRILAGFMHQENEAMMEWTPQQRDDLRTVIADAIEEHLENR